MLWLPRVREREPGLLPGLEPAQLARREPGREQVGPQQLLVQEQAPGLVPEPGRLQEQELAPGPACLAWPVEVAGILVPATSGASPREHVQSHQGQLPSRWFQSMEQAEPGRRVPELERPVPN